MSMTSKNKLIKQGIKYTDAVFDEIARRLGNGVKVSDTLEDFLAKYDLYTTNDEGEKEGKNKPILLSEYKDKMLQLILAETNNHKFTRPSQKEMVRVVIENNVGDLIVDVSEDVQDSVREIVKDGYNNELPQDEIAEQITRKVSSIKNRRARAIARTEIARTAVTSDYIISKERGATHFYVECRNTACPICKKAWHTKWTPENDATFTPKEYTAGEKGWIGDRTFSMSDTSKLPPLHPNCRCVPYFYKDNRGRQTIKTDETSTTTNTVVETKLQQETIDPKLQKLKDNLTDREFEQYQSLLKKIEKNTQRLEKAKPDDPRRIMYEAHLKSDKKALKRLEDMAKNPSNRKVTTEKVIVKSGEKNTDLDYHKINSYEDLANYFGFTLIEETDTQYGKSTTRYYLRDEKNNVRISGLDDFDFAETKEVLISYNGQNPILKKATNSIHLDPTTTIKELGTYNPAAGTIDIYSHKRDTEPDTIQGTVTHELTHAFDCMLTDKFAEFFSSESKEYRKIVREEGWGSDYSYRTKGATRINEDFAETGKMVLNRDNPNVKIRLKDGTDVTAKEWCEMFPKKVAFFEKVLKSKKAQELLV